MQRHSPEDRHSQERYLPGYAGAHLSAGYGGSQEDEHRYQRGYQPERQYGGYQSGGYQGGHHTSYQGGGYDRSQRGGYDRDDARGGSYDRDRDDGRGFAFPHNDDDRNHSGYQRDVSGGYGGGGYGDRFSESERGGGDYGRGYGRYEDDRGLSSYNMYARDRDFDRGHYDRHDYDRRDFDRGHHDRRDFDRHDFDRGPMGGYADRGSFAHDRDFDRGGAGWRDDRGAGWRDDRGGWYGDRSHAGYERSHRFDDARMPLERRWR